MRYYNKFQENFLKKNNKFYYVKIVKFEDIYFFNKF